MIKPWNHKTFSDIDKQRNRRYPPKDAKPWLYGTYPEMEYFVREGGLPIGAPTPDPAEDDCFTLCLASCEEGDDCIAMCKEACVDNAVVCSGNRSLWVRITPNSIECEDDTGYSLQVSPDFACVDIQQVLAEPEGASLNENDEIERGCLPEGERILFAVCDCECGGCSIIGIDIEECDMQISYCITDDKYWVTGGTPPYEVEVTSLHCVTESELPILEGGFGWGEKFTFDVQYCFVPVITATDTCGNATTTVDSVCFVGEDDEGAMDCSGLGFNISGPDTVPATGTTQYTQTGGCGGTDVWQITGEGATISQSGLVTTVNACGPIDIGVVDCGGCTGSLIVRAPGDWFVVSTEEDLCDSCGQSWCVESIITIEGEVKTHKRYFCIHEDSAGGWCNGCLGPKESDICTTCASTTNQPDGYLTYVRIWNWGCPP